MDARIRVRADDRIGNVKPEVFGTMIEDWGEVDRHAIYGSVWVGDDSPIPNVRGIRQDVAEATRAMGPTVIRWPGGCPADVYHWLDGVGPPEQRPTTVLPMTWSRGIEESNAFGTAEFIDFCRQVGAAPYINANAGTGTPEEAANWVEYCNRAGRGQHAALRASDGHPEPFGVAIWGVGNELYGSWEVGQMDAETYARTVLEYAKIMRMVDRKVKIVAVGCSRDAWNYPVLQRAGGAIDYISIHKYCRYEDYYLLVAFPLQAQRTFKRLEALTEAVAPSRSGGVITEVTPMQTLIAVDEWNVWHEEAGKQAFYQKLSLQDALFSAGMFHVFLRMCNSIGMANLCDLVNSGPCGPIVANEETIYVDPQYLAFQMYRYHIGDVVVRTEVEVDTYDAGEISALGEKVADRVDAVPYLDCVATLAEAEGKLFVAVINRHRDEDIPCAIELEGFCPRGSGGVFELGADDVTSANDFDTPDNVQVVERELVGASSSMTYEFPRHSITIIELAVI